VQNFFTLFGLEESFDIDMDQLDMRYFSLQSQYHPDRSSDLNTALLVNQGYKILQDNFERANHILELHGIFITNNTLAPKLPSETLEEILEIIESKTDIIPSILESIRCALDIKDYATASIHVLTLRYLEKGALERF